MVAAARQRKRAHPRRLVSWVRVEPGCEPPGPRTRQPPRKEPAPKQATAGTPRSTTQHVKAAFFLPTTTPDEQTVTGHEARGRERPAG